jgi:hypothetical protein
MRKTVAVIVSMLLSLPVFSQKTIREGMQQIKDNYDVSFIYDSGIDIDQPYQGDKLKGKSLRKDLSTLFRRTDIQTSVRKDQVILKQKPPKHTAGVAASAMSEVQLLDSSKIVDNKRPFLSYLAPRALGISDIAVTDASEMLKGRAPGVSVVSSPASLGTPPTMYIRGLATTTDARLLYVVDGARVYSLEGIAPDDIESIRAERNADVLTTFGPDAADGVVIVKTKKGNAPGLHVAYNPQLLFQKPAWASEPLTLDEYNGMISHLSTIYSADEYRAYTMEEETHTSVSKNHHISAQYGSSKLSAYAGVSFLDHDGPIKGDEGYLRNAGTWSVLFTPLKWLSFTTSGNLAKTNLKTDRQEAWQKLTGNIALKRIGEEPPYDLAYWRYASFLNAAATLEVRPFKGFSVKADAGYSNTYEIGADTTWPRQDRNMTFNGTGNTWTKWHAGAVAAYSAQLFRVHNLRSEILYRHRVEDYSLISAYGEVPLPVDDGVLWGDASGVVETYLYPEINTWLETPENWGHLSYANPTIWSWKRDQIAAWLEYDFKGRYSVKGAFMRQLGRTCKPVTGPSGLKAEPFDSWSVTARLNLLEEPLVNLHGSIGGSDIDCLNENTLLPVYRYPNGENHVVSREEVREHASQDYYSIDKGYSRRKEIGLDLVLSAAGELGFSATAFINDDNTISRVWVSSFPYTCPYSLSNKGLEMSIGYKGAAGAFHYAASGNLTLMKNVATVESEGLSGFEYKNGMKLMSGYPVGVSWLAAFNDDNYSYTEENGKTVASYYDTNPQFNYYGGVMPATCYGIQCMIGWKMLTLSASGHGMGGYSIRALGSYSVWRYYRDNYPAGWNGIMSTTAALLDGSFFRIDHLRLDCAIPMGRLPFKSSVYASLENYFLFTDYPGNDPEMALMSDSFGTENYKNPTSKRILTGICLEF